MILKVLMENTALDDRYVCEHGLSLYLETEKHRILFDTGQSGRFTENAESLGVDLSQIDIMILSHGHYDHSGGMQKFLQKNDRARIFARKTYDAPHFNAEKKYIGVDPALIGNPRIQIIDSDCRIDEELELLCYGNRVCKEPMDTAGLWQGDLKETGEMILEPEQFLHEHYLMIRENGKKILVSGCSHRGIRNIISWSEDDLPDIVIGGFHLMKVRPEQYERLDRLADILKTYPIQYYTCHCTGLDQYAYLKEKMGEQLHYIAAGTELQL